MENHSGSGGAVFIINLEKRGAQKLGRIILLHFGLVPLRFHFGKVRKPFVFMIFGLLEVSMIPQTNYVQLWVHQIIPNNSGNTKMFKAHLIIGNLKILELHKFEIVGKDGPENSGRSV